MILVTLLSILLDYLEKLTIGTVLLGAAIVLFVIFRKKNRDKPSHYKFLFLIPVALLAGSIYYFYPVARDMLYLFGVLIFE